MRDLLKMVLLGTLIMGLYSCGKASDSGSRSSSSSITNFGNGEMGTSFAEFSTLQSSYLNAAFSAGITEATAIHHIGPRYGGTFNTSSSSLGATFCVGDRNLFGNDDRCSSNSSLDSQLNDLIDRGEYKVIRSTSATSVDFGLANGVSNGTFTFSESVFDASNNLFREMLNLDDVSTRRVVVSDAQIQMSNSGQIDASLVEYFFEDGRYESYILSSALPLIANPIASYTGTYSVGGGVQFELDGRLSFFGQNSLTGISAQPHMLNNDFQTGQLIVVNTSGRIQ